MIFGRQLIGRTLLIIAARRRRAVRVLGLFFWLPPFLARPVEQGGAGMGVVGSLQWIMPMQIGAYFGYLTFGFIADRLGRRRTFVLFMLARPRSSCRSTARWRAARWCCSLLEPAARLLRARLLQHVRQLRRGAVPDGGARDGAGHELQRRAHGRRARAVHDRRARDAARRRHRPRAGLTSAFFLSAALLVFTLPDRSGRALE